MMNVYIEEHLALERVRALRAARRTRPAPDQLVLYPQLGHAPHWEHPEAFTRDVEAFLRRVTFG